jgi:hypothetical protein
MGAKVLEMSRQFFGRAAALYHRNDVRSVTIVFVGWRHGAWFDANRIPPAKDYFDETDIRNRCVLDYLMIRR